MIEPLAIIFFSLLRISGAAVVLAAFLGGDLNLEKVWTVLVSNTEHTLQELNYLRCGPTIYLGSFLRLRTQLSSLLFFHPQMSAAAHTWTVMESEVHGGIWGSAAGSSCWAAPIRPSLPAPWTLWPISMYLGHSDFYMCCYLALSKLTRTSAPMSLKDFCQECLVVFPKKENTKGETKAIWVDILSCSWL